MNDLIERLRALSRYEHSDYSIGEEAAKHIELLTFEVHEQRELHRTCLAAYKECATELAELKARSCAGCSRYLANPDYEGIGVCGYLDYDVAEDFGCVKWEPKT